MTAWLKVIGASSWPMKNDWGSDAPILLRSATFAKRPGEGSFVPGDDFAYYARRGDISRVVAIGRVTGRPRYEAHRDPGWPWQIDIALEAKRDLISDGIPLHRLDVDRTLTRSITQKSHIRLTPAEFALARCEFGLA